MRTWIYARASARDAAEEVNAQSHRLADRATELGLDLERLFADRSELDDERPERERMWELMAAGDRPEVLLIENLSRLWRPAEAVAGWRALGEAGVALVSAAEAIDTRSLEAAAHTWALLEALAALAREYRSERVAIGIHLARTRRAGTLAAWGGGRVRRVLPLEKIVDWYETGVSQAEMRRRLARRGVRAGARAISRAIDELWAEGLLTEDPAERRRRYRRGSWRGEGS